MYVCLYKFSSVDTAGGLYQFQQKGNKRIRGAVTKSIRFTRLGGLKRIRLQITDSVGRWLSTGC